MEYTKLKKISKDETLKVTIRLNDKCNNGHDDFSIVGEIEKDYKVVAWGSIHDEILKYFPEFKIFVDLHLSNSQGVPRFAIEDGFYHLQNDKKTAQEYLRLNDKEFNLVKNIKDKEYFKYVLETKGILKKWEEESKKAIKTLEKLTRKKYKDNTTKHYKYMTNKEKKIIQEKIKTGYYTKKEADKREKQKQKDIKNKKLKDLKRTYKNDMEDIRTTYNIKKWLINKNINKENIIYYPHKKKVCIGWRNKLTEKKIKTYKQKLKGFKWDYYFKK